MGKYSGYLIVSDIDNTLLANGKLPSENVDAIQRFQAEGGRFTLCTGRSSNFLSTFPFHCNAPVATINGTLLCDENGLPLVHMPLLADYRPVIRRILDSFPGILQADRYYEDHFDCWVRATGTDPAVLFTDAACYKFFFVCDTEHTALSVMAYIKENYGEEYETNRSYPLGVEIHQKNSGKGACVRKMRKLLPDVHTVIAAGDYENDVTMLQEADIGCAVDNAIPAVKAVADRVICSSDECAIRYIVDTLIPALPSFPKEN